MKKLFLILGVVMLSLSCNDNAKYKDESKVDSTVTEGSFDWLIGNWERTNEKDGIKTYENWVKNNNSEYIGIGFSLKENDTVSKENIRLIMSSNNWSLEVSIEDDISPTVFKVSELNNNSFTCENFENEFPNKIQYLKVENGIKAVVSGGNLEIIFEFEKISLNSN